MAEPEEEKPADEMTLRQWLDRPGRLVDRYECLHIFGQIAETVGLAHSQGVAVGSVRPSCFVMSAVNRVAFAESDSCSSSGSGSVDEGGGPGESGARVRFPLNQMVMLEDEWYASSEGGGFASDVYQLGVLLFEVNFSVFLIIYIIKKVII